jgi:hypothetical protein
MFEAIDTAYSSGVSPSLSLASTFRRVEQLLRVGDRPARRGGVERRHPPLSLSVNVGAELEEHIDAAPPALRAVVERGVVVVVALVQIGALGHQPAGECVGALVEVQRGLLAEPVVGVDRAVVEDRLQRLEALLLELLAKILRQRLPLRRHQLLGAPARPSAI